MRRTCEVCAGSGCQIGVPIPTAPSTTAGMPLPAGTVLCSVKDCPKCKGYGYYDDAELRTVPIKYIRSEFWKR